MRRLPLRSPPRVRGKVAMEHFSIAICGITPAYAGKSAPFLFTVPRGLDHPRVCGEKRFSRYWVVSPKGSPPHMRGKVFFFTGASFCAIFFLEPSGNLLLEPSGSSWVPPDGSIFVFAIGSPPRVRGKAKNRCRSCPLTRITPAYAGKSP